MEENRSAKERMALAYLTMALGLTAVGAAAFVYTKFSLLDYSLDNRTWVAVSHRCLPVIVADWSCERGLTEASSPILDIPTDRRHPWNDSKGKASIQRPHLD